MSDRSFFIFLLWTFVKQRDTIIPMGLNLNTKQRLSMAVAVTVVSFYMYYKLFSKPRPSIPIPESVSGVNAVGSVTTEMVSDLEKRVKCLETQLPAPPPVVNEAGIKISVPETPSVAVGGVPDNDVPSVAVEHAPA